MSSKSQLISMPEIAQLARVRRPVVSMWRSRSAGSDSPFPTVVDKQKGQEFFDVNEVGSWLARTGRGNNPEAKSDAPGHAQLPQPATPGTDTFAAATSLLVLRSMLGRPPVSYTHLTLPTIPLV